MLTPSPTTSLLHRFRADRKPSPLHSLEKAILILVAGHLCFLPWALGTMHPWSQLVSLGLSSVAFCLALIPRKLSQTDMHVGGTKSADQTVVPDAASSRAKTYRVSPLPRLLRFPLFWIGLALLAYIAIQGLNPSWVWTRNATSWWLVRSDDIRWLPTSIDAPFDRFNVWRQFIIYLSAWFTICTIWIGFTRRRSLQALLVAVLINAVVLAIVGMVHRIVSPYAFFGFYRWPAGHSAFASFIYKNHAGAFFSLIASLAVALALWTSSRGMRNGRRSTPAGILIFGALLLFAAVLLSASRGAAITLVGFGLLVSLWVFFRNWRVPTQNTSNRTITLLLVLVFAGTLFGTVRYLDFSGVARHFNVLAKDPMSSIEGRLMAYDSGAAMLKEHWLRGVGAGGFRHLFPEYLKKYSAASDEGRLFWEHVHRDWLELPIELGLVGTLLLCLGAGWAGYFFVRHHNTGWHFLAAPLLLGCSQTLLHAWFDFPFQCPALLITWLGLFAISARWVELDGPQAIGFDSPQ